MSTSDKVNTANNTIYGRSVVPFTGGIIVFIYAWFWPESYGHWLGTIVSSFRSAAGF